ncbi:MAG TPA: helix-turn-helix transcriptional regulator [Candidatus Limnocylindrales bacterium]|nr:helix-turn-helix transcriptional regulator [Candidatus Limnocylindrales bacterium]
MSTRTRPADLAVEDARRIVVASGREVLVARRCLGISQRAAARRAGLSPSTFGRIERAELRRASVEQLCRAARAVGLEPRMAYFPAGVPVHDRGQLPTFARFERLLGFPLRLRREVGLPIPGDPRAWDGRIEAPDGRASVEVEAKAGDIQALSRRIALKQRDDPLAGPVILVFNRTAHNRRVLAVHREALRAQFPLDGAAIARALRAGRLPPAAGVILV